MITHLKGEIIEKNNSYIIIDCNGVGYYIHISEYTYSFLSKIKKKYICIYTYLIIREHKHILYGFFDKKERKIFSYLISVNGIGPNLSIVLLSSISPYEIEKSIYEEDIGIFNKVKGIGKKTAQKIIIELKDKICKKSQVEYNGINIKYDTINNVKKEALYALHVLGFSHKDCENILDDILYKIPDISVENLVKKFFEKKD
ncbi:Holliday junction branch migration protein RuvA [Blattabacterium cuenoti]|uniref:Holliday junction branch migration protein RuvA n=1 Tax=Blattabacterium cuenoti TaxID=1653831 RepID=UPI00163C5BD3|nr:Holliday junction branch migration protein RuvA [Blattabacterium cuenoti]